MNTAEMIMTKSQEKALEYAIFYLVRSQVTRMNNCGTGTGKYRVVGCKINPLTAAINESLKKHNIDLMQEEANKKDTIELRMKFDNGTPGTLGYAHPTYAQLFIGLNGGFTCYVRDGKVRKTYNGHRALIYCTT